VCLFGAGRWPRSLKAFGRPQVRIAGRRHPPSVQRRCPGRMRQASWSGWASIRSHLPRWAGVPLLVAVVIMASLGWVILARGTSPADGTITFPSAPYWSERGVVINDVVPGVSGLRGGDCVVAVDGRPVEDLVRNGPVRNYNVGDVIRYDVRRSDTTLHRDCSGQLASIEVTLTSYRFGSVLREHASVLLLA